MGIIKNWIDRTIWAYLALLVGSRLFTEENDVEVIVSKSLMSAIAAVYLSTVFYLVPCLLVDAISYFLR
jgi:hypothetical protein